MINHTAYEEEKLHLDKIEETLEIAKLYVKIVQENLLLLVAKRF